MESWRMVWRDGFAPVLSTDGLERSGRPYAKTIRTSAKGATTTPPPLACNSERALEGCCSIGWCGWKGEKLETVGEVEEFFARSCFEADQLLGEPAACRWFLNWFDDTPRQQMRLELLAEVERTLEQRFFPANSGSRRPSPQARPAATSFCRLMGSLRAGSFTASLTLFCIASSCAALLAGIAYFVRGSFGRHRLLRARLTGHRLFVTARACRKDRRVFQKRRTA